MVTVQVLQWVLTPVQGAWTQPELLGDLASPDAFFNRYIALEAGPNNTVRVRIRSTESCPVRHTQRDTDDDPPDRRTCSPFILMVSATHAVVCIVSLHVCVPFRLC